MVGDCGLHFHGFDTLRKRLPFAPDILNGLLTECLPEVIGVKNGFLCESLEKRPSAEAPLELAQRAAIAVLSFDLNHVFSVCRRIGTENTHIDVRG